MVDFRSCALIAILLPGLAAADVPSPMQPVTAAFRRALGERASWTMVRQIGEKGPKLVSSGTVDCAVGSGIVWRVTAPFASTVSMTTNAMVFADEDGVRVKPLEDLPRYADIREKTDAFAAGDAEAFNGLFRIDGEVSPQGGWWLRMKPRISAMERLFTEIELTGAALPTNAILRTADGGSCVIRFEKN